MNFSIEDKELTDPQLYFHLWSGKDLKSLKELADHIREIGDEEYNYHVTPDKNDFATWVKDCFGEYKLAEELKKCKDKNEMYQTIVNYFLQKTTAKKKTINREDITNWSDKVIEKYDKKIQKINENLNPETNDEITKKTEKLQTAIEELETELSNLRKAGKNTFFPTITIRLAKSRLTIYKVTHSQEDYEHTNKLIQEAREELKEASKPEPDIKEEIEEIAKKTK